MSALNLNNPIGRLLDIHRKWLNPLVNFFKIPFYLIFLATEFIASSLCSLWLPIGCWFSALFLYRWLTFAGGTSWLSLAQKHYSGGPLAHGLVDFPIVYSAMVLLMALFFGFLISGLIRIIASNRMAFHFFLLGTLYLIWAIPSGDPVLGEALGMLLNKIFVDCFDISNFAQFTLGWQ